MLGSQGSGVAAGASSNQANANNNNNDSNSSKLKRLPLSPNNHSTLPAKLNALSSPNFAKYKVEKSPNQALNRINKNRMIPNQGTTGSKKNLHKKSFSP